VVRRGVREGRVVRRGVGEGRVVRRGVREGRVVRRGVREGKMSRGKKRVKSRGRVGRADQGRGVGIGKIESWYKGCHSLLCEGQRSEQLMLMAWTGCRREGGASPCEH
jgi:hypothetical protein